MTPHHSSKTSILVNGSPTFEFSIKRGLRQGNPISPFLFILVMEGLHVALSNAVQSGLIHGVKFGSPRITLSHLFYADDVMITTEWSSHDMDNIIHLLLDRFLSRLSSWKANLLFIDRLTLIKVFLESLEIYYLSIFKAPESVLKAMKRIRAMFFLGESQDSKKLAWIKWSNVLSSFDKGGLGIGSLKSFNLALLQKWHWRFISNPKLLWVKAIKALHGQEGGGLLAISISHLFYADDAVFIGEWMDSNLRSIIQMLHCFSLASGLKINLQKSNLLGVGVTGSLVNEAVASIGCSVMKAPFKYLGVMVG
ncbi:RNA-directed DNA polymerase, eukaryota, reverse transcriptase zinc-binding domain protein, partial [Tanacetum coccineum]